MCISARLVSVQVIAALCDGTPCSQDCSYRKLFCGLVIGQVRCGVNNIAFDCIVLGVEERISLSVLLRSWPSLETRGQASTLW